MTDYKKKICPLPFTQLSFHSSGKVTPCCWLYDYDLGNIEKQSIQEIWNSDKLKIIRREFIEGNPVVCSKHINQSQCNYHHSDLDPLVELKEVLPMPMKKLDLMLNGKCNLQCIMCHNWKDPNGKYTDETFWNEARKDIFPYIKVIEVYGGEPFIQGDVTQLVEEVSKVNPDCQWMFTTNGHYSFEKVLLPVLDKVNIKSISVSIDSLIPETFSKIRKLGKLEVVQDTLEKLIEHKKKSDYLVVINMVVQKDNWKELPSFIEYCRENDLQLFPYLLTEPIEYSLNELAIDEKKKIVEFYLSRNEELKSLNLLSFTKKLLKTIPPLNAPELHLDFAEHYTRNSGQLKA